MQIGVLEPRHFSKKAKKDLEAYGNVEFFDGENKKDFLLNKEILFIRLKYKLNKDFLEEAKELKYICTPTTGLNHLDLGAVNIRVIKIISLKGENKFLSTIRATPEHTIGLLLSLLRNYNKSFLNTSNKVWNRDLYKGYEVYGKTIGIIGMGRVGKILSKYFEAFDAKVIYIDIDKVEAPRNAVSTCSMLELIEQSDIVFLTASYSIENEKMISKKELDLMKGKFFINTARGELVDELYLIEKIKENHFNGVALDVINNETDLDNNQLQNLLPLCDKNNLILTPHIAGATYESMWRTEEFITDKLIKEYM